MNYVMRVSVRNERQKHILIRFGTKSVLICRQMGNITADKPIIEDIYVLNVRIDNVRAIYHNFRGNGMKLMIIWKFFRNFSSF